MFILAHLAAGLIIGKISGSYLPSLIGSLAMDLDHLIPYIRHKVLFSPKKFWDAITSPEDAYGNQRNFLHSFIAWAAASSIFMTVNFNIGLIFSLGYLCHLLLDLIDGSDFHPLYPFKLNVRGPIKYLSKPEMLFTTALFFIFFII